MGESGGGDEEESGSAPNLSSASRSSQLRSPTAFTASVEAVAAVPGSTRGLVDCSRRRDRMELTISRRR